MMEFIIAHPWISLFALMVICHTPIAIIQALKNKSDAN